MRRDTAALAASAALLVAGLVACGDEPAGVSVAPSSGPAGRSELLATCPAKAPAWTDDAPAPAATDDPAFQDRQAQLLRGAQAAQDYLTSLPADQAGGVRIDNAAGAVVVQVTRDAERVRRELQDRLGDDARAEVETVRWSDTELSRTAEKIRSLPGLEFSSIGHGANGRVEVEVPTAEAIPAATALIAESVDPCMFTVTQGGPYAPATEAAAVAPATAPAMP